MDSIDTIGVETLVQEFFAQQSLKILPQGAFGDAVNQFVTKDDKHAVEVFVMESLTSQVKELLHLDEDKIQEGLDAHIEEFRKVMEKNFVTGQERQAQRKRRMRPQPDDWDSDKDGHWTAQPGVLEDAPSSPEAPDQGRTLPTSGVLFSDDEDNEMVIDDAPTKKPIRKAPAPKVTAKKAPAPKKAPAAKKAAPAKKAPARGRKKANPFIDSDEEEDVIMVDDNDEPTVSQAPRSQPARATRASARTNMKQTTLNFSQARTSQKAIEISDDEISDDAFESMPTKRNRRR